MKKTELLASLLVATATLGCGKTSPLCECAYGLVGLVLTTDAPVTQVVLSGTACGKAHFRCVPAELDDKIHDGCTEVQVVPEAAGSCIVDLQVGGVAVHVERDIVKSPCKCFDTFYVEANQAGEIDLRKRADAGADVVQSDLRTRADAGADVHSQPSFYFGVDMSDCPNPSWLVELINAIGHTLYRTSYKGDTAFYVSEGCCDKFNSLYDRCGTLLCYPDGGMSGLGDGRCPDFFSSPDAEWIQIWP